MTVQDSHPISTAPVALAPGVIPLRNAVCVAVLVGLADWLFYDHDVGISLVIFLVALGAGVVAANPPDIGRRNLIVASLILLMGVLPFVVQPSMLAALFGIVAVAYFSVTIVDRESAWTKRLIDGLFLLRDVTWRAPADVTTAVRERSIRPRWSLLLGWIVPLGLGAVFVVLLSAANPIIESLLPTFDLTRLIAAIDIPRTILWLLFACCVWPFILLRRRASKTTPDTPSPATPNAPLIALPAVVLNRTVILRSLLLFNALFAVQTALDLIYLWGGRALPDGITYAGYAHRGAYPLIVTALLAAAFVIVALKPGSDEERSRPIRLLVFAFIAQNVLLVASSILRLDLYVEVYSLSYWRLAAGIWMGLVATGLLLIVLRIALGRSNRWLISMNAIVLATTLYAVNFINLPAFIANYNVAHSRQISGQGQPLDVGYLLSLGEHAIPALDRYMAAALMPNATFVSDFRNRRRTDHLARMKNWRAWSVFDAALRRYLDSNPVAPVVGQPD